MQVLRARRRSATPALAEDEDSFAAREIDRALRVFEAAVNPTACDTHPLLEVLERARV